MSFFISYLLGFSFKLGINNNFLKGYMGDFPFPIAAAF